jgi:hypothetical protein
VAPVVKRVEKAQEKPQQAKPSATVRSQKKKPSKPMVLQAPPPAGDAPQKDTAAPTPAAAGGPLSSITGAFRRAIATTGIIQP